MVHKLNGHHSEPAITRERQRFSKIHESNRNIFMWRSRSCLSCGVEVNAVPDDRMNERQNDYRNPSCRGLITKTRVWHPMARMISGQLLLKIRSELTLVLP